MAGRLATVLRVRRIREQQALADTARAEAEVARAERDVEEAAHRRLAWTMPTGAPLDRTRLRARQLEVLALHDREAAAMAEAAAAVVQRDRARRQWHQARTALESVERLDRQRAATMAAEAAARAQAAADEMALLRRGARR